MSVRRVNSHAEPVIQFPHSPSALAAAPPPPVATERSPLLYAWLLLQVIVIVLIVYFAVRFVRKWVRRS